MSPAATAKMHEARRVPHPTDNELMTNINGGDVESNLTMLRQRYGAAILGYVGGILRDEHLAEDVAQEVFAKVFFKSHLYRPDSNFRAWLFEIARNQALTALRRRRHTPKPVGSLELPHNDWGEDGGILENLPDERIDRQMEEREFMTAFATAVHSLPKSYSQVFELCVQQGVPYQEAAERLQIPTGTVAIRIMRARKRLYSQLAHHMDRVRRPPACLQ